jgi:hypothetical protein
LSKYGLFTVTRDMIEAAISICSDILEFMLLNIPNPKTCDTSLCRSLNSTDDATLNEYNLPRVSFILLLRYDYKGAAG